jgi:hypothetical protein
MSALSYFNFPLSSRSCLRAQYDSRHDGRLNRSELFIPGESQVSACAGMDSKRHLTFPAREAVTATPGISFGL